MLGAARIGERELLALGAEIGWDTLHAHEREWFDYSETAHGRRRSARCRPARVTRTQHARPVPGTPGGGRSPIKVTVDGRRRTPQ